MDRNIPLFEKNTLVELMIDKGWELVQDFIERCCIKGKMDIDQLKFKCSKKFDYVEGSVDVILDAKAPFIDVMLARSLYIRYGRAVEWIIAEYDDELDYNENNVKWSIFIVYFLLMTRGRVIMNEGEKIPKFLRTQAPEEITVTRAVRLLTNNNIDAFNHSWILEIQLEKISESVRSRFQMGVAGSRNLMAIVKYECREDVSPTIKQMIMNLRKKLSEGKMYKEMHVFGQPMELRNKKISKSIGNFILDYYSQDTISAMIKDRAIFQRPSYDRTLMEYKKWKEDFFNYLKTEWK